MFETSIGLNGIEARCASYNLVDSSVNPHSSVNSVNGSCHSVNFHTRWQGGNPDKINNPQEIFRNQLACRVTPWGSKNVPRGTIKNFTNQLNFNSYEQSNQNGCDPKCRIPPNKWNNFKRSRTRSKVNCERLHN